MLDTDLILSGNFTRDQMMSQITYGYCHEVICRNIPIPKPEKIACEIVNDINMVCRVANSSREKGERWKPVEELDHTRTAILLAELNLVRRVQLNEDEDEKSYVLGIYEPEGPKRGLYNIDEDAINCLCRRYNGSLRKKDISEIKAVLMDTAPIVKRCFDPDLIPVNNGIFDYKKKQLIDFDPKYVFTSKCGTDYIPNAQNPILSNPDGTVWDVESWIESLVSNHPDKDEMADLLWKIIGATVRYLVPWNKAAFLISPKGNNGKGTLCELMRSLLGSGNYANIPIANFSKEYLLETLARVNVILTDENDVGIYLDSSGNLKAAITRDLMQLNRKYKTPIMLRFRGFMVQCLNDHPNFRDKTDSLFRRQLYVPMTQCFTNAERKYIKTDYVHRKEVLEYVLFKVLNMDYDQLPVPKSCQEELENSRQINDPVLQFMNDFMDEFTWDLLPFTFLYTLYRKWYEKNVPGKPALSRARFMQELKRNLPSFPEWTTYTNASGKDLEVGSKGKMDKPELLIMSYNLDDWKNPNYTGGNLNTICMPLLKRNYRGIIRVCANNDKDDATEE